MLIFELQNSFPNTAPYKNILTNSYHYSFITSEHYRHNASKQLFNKSACGPIKYNLLYINAIQLHFWNPVYNHYKDGSTPSNYTRHKHRWKTSRLEWMSPWPLTFDITRPLELQLTKKTIMYRVHKPSTSELRQWIDDFLTTIPVVCYNLEGYTRADKSLQQNLRFPLSLEFFASFSFIILYLSVYSPWII